MVGQHGLNLAVDIITTHFGDFVAKVCSCLLHRGSLSLQEIARDTGFSHSRAKNCLLVLIQHNCVQAYSISRGGAPGASPKVVTQYMALFDNILHRLRFTKFLAIVAGEFDDHQCEALIEGLLQHGRLTFEQLVMRATSKPKENEEDETPSTRKRGAKSAIQTETLEQQALAAAALLDAERFSGFGDGVLDEKLGGKSLGGNIGEKRKHEELEFDKETQAAINENEVLWRANFEKLVHCLKKKVCVASVRERLSLDAAVVLEAMIESSNQQKPKDNSVTSSLDDILEWVMKRPGGRLMTMQHVRTCLEELKCKSSIGDARALYSIDLGDIVEECLREEVESLVLQRYGKEAYRIFRLLMKKNRPVETDSISDITFVEKKEAQGILYKLWMDSYLLMEFAVAYPGERRFLWKVNTGTLYEHILNEMYHAVLNLSQKIAQSREQPLEVVEQQAEDNQKKESNRLKKMRIIILETSLLRLDDALMLFHDF
uniref:DNA-directed RNA polymerase III subunit RPC3 n=1 Tax=Anthurium amnicola TaxID=1678845 RepID=A0A1D1ZJI4_9ARAE